MASLSADEPIHSARQDLLGHVALGRNLANLLGSVPRGQCTVMAVTGPWGSGKTSLVNLTLEALTPRANGREQIVVRFNPWLVSGQDQVIGEFFAVVTNTLKSTNHPERWNSIVRLLNQYALLLTVLPQVPHAPGLMSLLTKAGPIVLNAYLQRRQHRPLSEIRNDIRQALQGQDSHILVVIDDIDRLTDFEMRQIFQLVKWNADFPSVTYLLAMDRSAVAAAIDRDMPGRGAAYIEKIVQLEVALPELPPARLLELLITELDSITRGQVHGAEVQRFGQLLPSWPRMPTIRHIRRFISALSLLYEPLKQEVNAVDFASMMALRYSYPQLYSALSSQKSFLTGVSSSDRPAEQAAIGALLGGSDVGEADRERVLDLLIGIFPRLRSTFRNTGYGPQWYVDWTRNLRVCTRNHFDKYFLFDTPKGTLTEARYRAAVRSIEERGGIPVLRHLVDEGMLLQFCDRFSIEAGAIGQATSRAVIEGLLAVGDALASHVALGEDPHGAVIRGLLHSINEIPPDFRQSELEALLGSGVALRTMVRLVSVLFPEPGAPQVEEPLVPLTAGPKLKQAVVARIESLLSGETFFTVDGLDWILMAWHLWGDPDRVHTFVRELGSAQRGFVKILATYSGRGIPVTAEFEPRQLPIQIQYDALEWSFPGFVDSPSRGRSRDSWNDRRRRRPWRASLCGRDGRGTGPQVVAAAPSRLSRPLLPPPGLRKPAAAPG